MLRQSLNSIREFQLPPAISHSLNNSIKSIVLGQDGYQQHITRSYKRFAVHRHFDFSSVPVPLQFKHYNTPTVYVKPLNPTHNCIGLAELPNTFLFNDSIPYFVNMIYEFALKNNYCSHMNVLDVDFHIVERCSKTEMDYFNNDEFDHYECKNAAFGIPIVSLNGDNANYPVSYIHDNELILYQTKRFGPDSGYIADYTNLIHTKQSVERIFYELPAVSTEIYMNVRV